MKGFLHIIREWIGRFGGVDRTAGEVADLIQGFLDGTGGDYDWDDLVSIPIKDRALRRFVRENVVGVEDRFPPTKNEHFTSEKGEQWLREMVVKLREMERERLAAIQSSSEGKCESNGIKS
jgi:hypothetical protein